MNPGKKTRKDAPDSSPENVSGSGQIPQKKRVHILVFLLVVFASIAVLVYGLYRLYTGELFTIDKISLLYDKVLAARSGNLLVALIFLCLALVFLVYAVYGLRRGGLRNIIPSRYTLSDTTYYQGLPMWLMFLSYLSLSVYFIVSAITLVSNDNRGYVSRASWKWEAHDVFLILWLVLLFAAGWLDNAVGSRNLRDVLASLKKRFGGGA